MAEELLGKLLKVITQSEKVELTILHNATFENAKAYKDEPSKANMADWQVAKTALTEMTEGMSVKYEIGRPAASEEEDPDAFDTKLDVWRWLSENGYDIGRSAFYEHCKIGYLRPDSVSGFYPLKKVLRYARDHVRLAATGEKETTRIGRLAEKKAEVDFEQSQIKLEKEKLDLASRQGKYVKREDVELDLVGRAVAFAAGLRHQVQVSTPDWIDLVKGDQGMASELVAAMTESFEQRLSDFSRPMEFDVILEKDA